MPKKKAMQKRTGKNQKGFGYFVTGMPDGTTKQMRIPKKRMKDVSKYINAHNLLPDVSDLRELKPLVDEAVTVVGDATSTHSELLRAIVLLGHTPCERAYKALADHSFSNRPYSGVAEVALAECISFDETVSAVM